MKGLGISNLDGEVLYASRASFVVLLSEAADVYINNRTKSTAFSATGFYKSSEDLLKELCYLDGEFSRPLKPSFIRFRS